MNKKPSMDVKNLSNRRLWELVTSDQNNPQHRQWAERELILRRHYQPELQSYRGQSAHGC